MPARKSSPPRRLPGAARVVVPEISPKRFFGHGLPGVDLAKLSGKLIVIEGADGSGRSTQIGQLAHWLEGNGHATLQVGLKRSTLVSEQLEQAQQGNILSRSTLSLFYATDFADQLEHSILPALRAGVVVLADRYIYTLMARDLVRGMDEAWLRNLFGIALVPDAVFYLEVSPEQLVQRVGDGSGKATQRIGEAAGRRVFQRVADKIADDLVHARCIAIEPCGPQVGLNPVACEAS